MSGSRPSASWRSKLPTTGCWYPELASGIARIKGVRSHGVRVGNWLSLQQAQRLLNAPDVTTKKGLRDRAMFATLLGCGLRRSELANLRRASKLPTDQVKMHRARDPSQSDSLITAWQ